MGMMFQKLREIKLRGIMGAFGFVVIAGTIVAFWVFLYMFAMTFYFPDDTDSELSSVSDTENIEQDCNVLGISLHGYLTTYIPLDLSNDVSGDYLDTTASERIMAGILDAEADPAIKAIFLEVDSGGGSPVAGEEVADSLRHASKPTVALIRDAGNSAAYLAVSGVNTIFASKYSDIGSIGITLSYLDESAKNQKEGLTYNQLSTGKFKDMFDPNKQLTDEEKALISRDLKIAHENFIKEVAENRKLDVEKVRVLADGSSMLGEMALQNGLIDKIGSFTEVENYLRDVIKQKPVICWQ